MKKCTKKWTNNRSYLKMLVFNYLLLYSKPNLLVISSVLYISVMFHNLDDVVYSGF